MDPDVDASTEPSANGDGGLTAESHQGDDDESAGTVGGNGDALTPTGTERGPKRRSTPVTAAPPPERGTASQRGASSSSIARKPATNGPTSAPSDVASTDPGATVVAVAAGSTIDEAATVDGEVDAPPTVAPPPSGPPPTVFDDEATSAPFGMPIVLPPAPDTGEDRGTDVEPLPLPIVTPTIAPASRGSYAPDITEPPLLPFVVPPDAPLEPPYVTTSMTSHNVAPVPRIVGRRPRVRKVTRVVRHVDPWSVFKVALVFNLVVYGVLLTAGVLLWNVAYATGTIDNLERFFESFGWETFEFNGGAIYHSAWIAGLFGVIGLTGAAVLGATLFNLITDLVGGVRMTVLEEEVVERTASPMRRFVVRRPSSAPARSGACAGPPASPRRAARRPVRVASTAGPGL